MMFLKKLMIMIGDNDDDLEESDGHNLVVGDQVVGGVLGKKE